MNDLEWHGIRLCMQWNNSEMDEDITMWLFMLLLLVRPLATFLPLILSMRVTVVFPHIISCWIVVKRKCALHSHSLTTITFDVTRHTLRLWSNDYENYKLKAQYSTQTSVTFCGLCAVCVCVCVNVNTEKETVSVRVQCGNEDEEKNMHATPRRWSIASIHTFFIMYNKKCKKEVTCARRWVFVSCFRYTRNKIRWKIMSIRKCVSSLMSPQRSLPVRLLLGRAQSIDTVIKQKRASNQTDINILLLRFFFVAADVVIWFRLNLTSVIFGHWCHNLQIFIASLSLKKDACKGWDFLFTTHFDQCFSPIFSDIHNRSFLLANCVKRPIRR